MKLALHLLTLTLFASPIAGQDACPRASGPDAEAGWAAYTAGDISNSRARFEAAIRRCTDDYYAHTGLGYVSLREGQTALARSHFATVVGVQPNDVDALTGLGLVAWRMGDLDGVETYFGRVVQLVPDHPTAREYLDRIAGNGSSDEEDTADLAWRDGDTSRAFTLYMARLGNDPDDAVATLRVGLVRAWQGDYGTALDLLGPLVEREPGNLDARLAHARVLAWSGKLSQAEEEVVDILDVDPDHPEALEALALFQSWAGDVDEALASYDELIAISPQSGSVSRQRAQALAWASRFEASRAAYDALLTRNPDDVEARLGLARTLGYAQRFEASIEEYDRVLSEDSGNQQAMVGKARTLGWAGRLIDGERAALDAVRAHRESGEAWAVLGQLYRWQGRDAAAKSALETAARLAPTNAEVLDQLRSVDLALVPLARPTVVYESDSDENRMVTTRLSASWHPVPRLSVWADGYYKDLRQGAFQRRAGGAEVRGTYQIEPGWRVTAGVGGSRTDGTGRPSLVEYRGEVSSPARYPVIASLSVASYGLNETAVLAELGARSTGVLLTARWDPAAEWRIDGSLGVGEYRGVEANGRRSASLSASRRLGRFFSAGAAFRGFSFEKNLDEGYFDPDFYGITELTGYWLYRPSSWTLLVEAAPGIQKVRTDGDWSTTIRANARVGYGFAPGREVSLSFGYSSAGLVSFSPTAVDYRYTTLVLASSWAF